MYDYLYKAEYATSNRASCKRCVEPIPEGSLRLALVVQSPDFDGKVFDWFHFECFWFHGKPALSTDINGFDSLRWEDQEKIKDKLPVNRAKKRKSEAIGDSADVVDGKKQKVDDTETQRLKSQSNLMWALRDSLQRDVSLIAMKGLLKHNNQTVVNSKSQLLDRLSDCMAFGALAPCPECSQGQLVYSTAAYQCTGNLSGWTKCTYTTRTPKRVAFNVPPKYHDVAFLKSYKYIERQRVFPQATLAASSVNDEPLRGLCFLIHGNMEKTKPNIKKMLIDLGADVASKLETNVHAVISTSDELKKGGKVIKGAEAMDIPVLAEGFLEACGEGKLSEALTSYKLSNWGKELTVAGVADSKPPKLTMSSAIEAVELIDEKTFSKDSSGLQKLTVGGGAAVDPDFDLEPHARILQENGILFNTVLIKVDVKSGANTFYKLQALEHDKTRRYWLFSKWGRIGTSIGGRKKPEQLGSRQSCIDKFKKLYIKKTGNEWASEGFVKLPNRFFRPEIDYHQGRYAEGVGKISNLPMSVQQLVKLIFDRENMNKTMVQLEIDLNKMPLRRLSKKNITAAYKLLQTCQQLVDENASPAKILDTSNQFYHLIPHDFGMKKPPLLNNLDIIKLKAEMLENLQELEVASSLLRSSDGEDMDTLYKLLKTKIEPVSKESGEWELITKYVENTHGKTCNKYKLQTVEIFSVQRSGESSRYSPFTELPNRMLLWHGSRLTNYVGILSKGLRVAPPEAPVTGYLFGKGIYFADMVAKSGHYCFTDKSNPTGLLLLCEVALGNMHELGAPNHFIQLPKDKNSVKGCGRFEPDPSVSYKTDDGVVVPFGPCVDAIHRMGKESMEYNEYIVYDVAQVNIKYLVKCKFNYD